jgi:catechol 2,3-dioxygenase-like lactoylglutathione lyase family enzyme
MNDAQGRLTYIAPVFRVRDLKRSLAFYRDQLGFGLDFCSDDFYASVSRDGCYLHLQCADPPSRDQAAFERAELMDACVVVPDAEASSSVLASAGVPFTVPPRHMPYGVEFYIRDPDGYVLGFVQPALE